MNIVIFLKMSLDLEAPENRIAAMTKRFYDELYTTRNLSSKNYTFLLDSEYDHLIRDVKKAKATRFLAAEC